MKIIVERSVLLPALQRAARTADPKSTLAALGLVHLDARDSCLRVAATTLELSSSATVGAVVLEPGFFGVAAKGLLERVTNMPDTALTLATQDKPGLSLRITAPRTQRAYTMHAIPGDDLPKIPEPPAKVRTLYNADELMGLLRRCSSAMSDDGSSLRLHLHCVWVDLGDQLCVYATDGHRLHQAGVPTPNAEQLNIPYDVVTQLQRLCAELEADSQVELRMSATNLFFVAGTVVLGAKRVEAHRPQFEQVIPRSPGKTNVSLNRAALLSAVKTCKVVSDRVRVEVLCEGRDRTAATMFLRSADGADEGDSVDSIECMLEGDATIKPVVLICQNILDALGAPADQERVRIELGGDLDPAKVVAPEFLAVLMPTRAGYVSGDASPRQARTGQASAQCAVVTPGPPALHSFRLAPTHPTWRKHRRALVQCDGDAAPRLGARPRARGHARHPHL